VRIGDTLQRSPLPNLRAPPGSHRVLQSLVKTWFMLVNLHLWAEYCTLLALLFMSRHDVFGKL
jgi:hypothetical protein